jgi:inorganic phosphate transporter, PiT family
MMLFLLVLLAALVFEYINGFHDAANAIATVVSTKVLTARQAIMMAAACDLIGAFLGPLWPRRSARDWWIRAWSPCSPYCVR